MMHQDRAEFFSPDQKSALPHIRVEFDPETGSLEVSSPNGALVLRPVVSNVVTVKVER